jgi:LPXTG-motif cell wall-anchored protein
VDENGKTVAPDKVDQITYEKTGTNDVGDDSLSTAGDWTPARGDCVIHLKHKTESTKETEEVTRTIYYVDENGKTVAPDKVDKITYEKTGTKDLVDDSLSTAGDWTPASGDFAEVTSPILENYSDPSIPVVEAVTGVAPDAEDIVETVVYTAKTEAVTDTKTVDQVIHYIYEDGTEAAPDSTDSVHFTRTGSKNLATGDITWNDWTADNDDTTIDGVDSPMIEGYTADILTVDARTDLTADSQPSEITVTYKKTPEAAPTPSDDGAPTPSDDGDKTPAPETPQPTPPASTPTAVVLPTATPAREEPTKATLPSTGETKTAAVAVGAVLVTSAAILSILSRLKKKRQ